MRDSTRIAVFLLSSWAEKVWLLLSFLSEPLNHSSFEAEDKFSPVTAAGAAADDVAHPPARRARVEHREHVAIGALSGFASGLLGVGGGLLMMTLLGHSMPQHEAVATCIVALLPTGPYMAVGVAIVALSIMLLWFLPQHSAARLLPSRSCGRIAAPPATYKNYPSNCKFSNYKEEKSTLAKERKPSF